MARMRRKSELPTKVCVACARPFTWRKKWARDWDEVKYCSDACRRQGSTRNTATGVSAPRRARDAR